MKKIMMALLATVLALPMLAVAQSGQMQNDQQGQTQNDKQMQQQANQAAGTDQTGQAPMAKHTMAGMVSSDGKGFTSGDTTYVVNNPKSLKKYENQNVSVKFQFDTNNNTIHIITVSPAQ